MEVVGHLDQADHARISGWARDQEAPDRPVVLLILDNGEMVARVVANKFRLDLFTPSDLGNRGRLSFDISVTLSPLKRHLIEVIGEVTGEHLNGSPAVLEASTLLDDASKAAIADVMAAGTTETEIAERLAFLAAQTEAVLRSNDRRQNRQNERAAREALIWRSGQSFDQLSGSERFDKETAPQPRRSALVIDQCMPVLSRDAGSVAILSHMSSLQRLGYTVTFLPVDLAGDTTVMERRRIHSLTRPWYASVEEALARHNAAFDLIYLHRTESAVPYLQLVRRYQPDAHVVFGVADLASLRIGRQAEVEERPELRAWARHLGAMEIAASRQADAIITHSSFEASILRKTIDAKKIHVVPFEVGGRETLVSYADRNGLAFIGSFPHLPNADAARWLAEVIMPKVALLHPTIACQIVGSGMPDYIRKLASGTLLPVGAIDDLSVIFDRVRLTIAPLAYGAGVKGKVLSSLAAGVPCVCTPIAAEGLDLPPMLQGLVASDPDTLAGLVVRLHEEESFNLECSAAGLEYIATRGSEKAVDAAMKGAIASFHDALS